MSQPAFDFDQPPPGAGAEDLVEPTYSVGELATLINQTLRRGLGDGVWIRGEIQGWSDRGKHAYFTLAENGDAPPAVINVQFFAHARSKLRPLLAKHRLDLADGIAVRIYGQLDFWAPGGRLGFKMTGIDPRFTLGELALARDALVRDLMASGHFDDNRSLPMPLAPLRVGVVTSMGTAAWHDVRDELDRSGLAFHLSAIDTRVQGDGAAAMVAAAITTLSRRGDLDVIAVIRGGGARNELATFDAEVIARAVLGSQIPVITGLGHEVDRSVADEVAHTALKTPTACAGLLIERVVAARTASELRWSGIEAAAQRRLDESLSRLGDRAHRVARRTHSAVERADGRLSARTDALARRLPQVLGAAQHNLDRSAQRLAQIPGRLLEMETRRLDAIDARVAARDPAALLARGWSITVDDQGRAVRSVSEAPAGSILRTRVADGTITSRVEEHSND